MGTGYSVFICGTDILMLPHQAFDAVANPIAVLKLLLSCLLHSPAPPLDEVSGGIGMMKNLGKAQ